MEEDFKVDLKQLVEDLQAKTTKLGEVEKQLEEKDKLLEEKDKALEDLTTKYSDLEKTNSDLHLKIAQNIITPPKEEKPKENEISFDDMIKELGRGR